MRAVLAAGDALVRLLCVAVLAAPLWLPFAPARADGQLPLHLDPAFVSRLLDEAAIATVGYRVADLPAVEILSVEDMARLCGHCVAMYRRNVVMLRADRPLGRAFADSLLYHELVHHVQDVTGRFGHMPDCAAAHAREAEAYRLQAEWLNRQGVRHQVRLPSRLCLAEPAVLR